ncbi:PhoH family protein [Veillonella sp.]|uniref:PhoH family protein n=3 Tax=Veillonellaceae TaxID=31977 RepID=UPI0025FB4CDD|nr:PhoH family protein [Veillonella sp.]
MTERTFTFPRYEMAAPILGMQERNLKIIVEELPCQVVSRGDTLQLKGDDEIVNHFWRVLEELVFLYKESSAITEQQIRMAVRMVKSGKADLLHTMFEDTINVTMKGRMITPKTEGQKVYVDSIRRNTITFGIGPAGTGKTFLAVALAAFYLKNRDVERIILTRPAVEAGEKLGYLPGDLKEKVDPYLRPLYDALNDMFGLEQVDRFMLRGIIEVAPLAYMRGRTLENAFIILDEAQNTTPEQMKMFLTRLGNNSKMVINGDRTQIDLPGRMVSGLIEAENVLTGLAGISMVHFTDADVVRHDLVSKIIRAYERYEVKRTGRDLNKPLSKQKNDKTDKQAKADKTVKNDSTDVIAKEFDTPVQKTDTTQEEGRRNL